MNDITYVMWWTKEYCATPEVGITELVEYLYSSNIDISDMGIIEAVELVNEDVNVLMFTQDEVEYIRADLIDELGFTYCDNKNRIQQIEILLELLSCMF